jgi:hypothetical protein
MNVNNSLHDYADKLMSFVNSVVVHCHRCVMLYSYSYLFTEDYHVQGTTLSLQPLGIGQLFRTYNVIK